MTDRLRDGHGPALRDLRLSITDRSRRLTGGEPLLREGVPVL